MGARASIGICRWIGTTREAESLRMSNCGRKDLPTKIELSTPGSQEFADAKILVKRFFSEAKEYEKRERVDREQVKWDRCCDVIVNILRKL